MCVCIYVDGWIDNVEHPHNLCFRKFVGDLDILRPIQRVGFKKGDEMFNE